MFGHGWVRVDAPINDQGHTMKYASLASPAPGIAARHSTLSAKALSGIRCALFTAGRLLRALAEGYAEGRRLQAEVMARRGHPHGSD